MKVLHWIKWIIISLVLLMFVPMGVEGLHEFVLSLDKTDEQAVMDTDKTILDNPTGFDRMYHLQFGGDLHTFTKLTTMESKIRSVYDNYGIQLYFVEYVMDYTKLHTTVNESVMEVQQYLKDNDILKPYGIYYVVAEYDAPSFMDPDYDASVHYWQTEIAGYVIFGEEADKWWTTAVQKEFERVAEKYEFRFNSYNDYENFINVMSELRVSGELTTVVPDGDDVSYAQLALFLIFAVFPIGLAGIVLHADLKRYKAAKQKMLEEEERIKAEETQRILNTPLRTLEEEQAEDLLNKYNDNSERS